jgi:hypothetical protein
MSTGGVDFFSKATEALDKGASDQALPDYLSPTKSSQLQEVPVTFLGNIAKPLPQGAAEITHQLGKMGPSAMATLYYGTVDCITFIAGKPVNNSAAERDIYSPKRIWQASVGPQAVNPGNVVFHIKGLTPGKTYYYRLFVNHAEGKSWDAISGSFVAR